MKTLNKNAKPFKLPLATHEVYRENDPDFVMNSLYFQDMYYNMTDVPLRRYSEEEIIDGIKFGK